MKNKKQSGFAVIETLLILIIIAIIGGVSWYVLHTKNQTDKILDNAASTSKKSSVDSTNSNFMKIKEWGVAIPLTQTSDGYYYEISADNPSWALISSKVTDGMIGPSGGVCKGSHIAAIVRQRPNPLDPSLVTAGNYSYLIAANVNKAPACLYENQNANNPQGPDNNLVQQWISITKSFVSDFHSLKAD